MTGKTETRVREIGRRTRQYRKRYETRLLSCLTACSLFLLAGIGVLFRSVQTSGVASVADGYGGVLLQDGAGAYVIVGIVAFVIGVSAVSYTHLDVYKRQASNSSNRITKLSFFARSKTFLMLLAVSPKYDDTNASNLTYINGIPISAARMLAHNVFPQPGGP